MEDEVKLPRVILADDHTILLEALRKLLESKCEVIGATTDGRSLLQNSSSPEAGSDRSGCRYAAPEWSRGRAPT
jgi:hypothetical protein